VFIECIRHSLEKSKNLLHPRPNEMFLTNGAYIDLLKGAPYKFQKLKLDLFSEETGGAYVAKSHGFEFWNSLFA
jgi:hypothetical protein